MSEAFNQEHRETPEYLAHLPYQAYLLTNHWGRFRRRAIAHYGGRCERCSAERRLEVHHLRYPTLGTETMDDVRVLCRRCHDARHGQRRPRYYDSDATDWPVGPDPRWDPDEGQPDGLETLLYFMGEEGDASADPSEET